MSSAAAVISILGLKQAELNLRLVHRIPNFVYKCYIYLGIPDLCQH